MGLVDRRKGGQVQYLGRDIVPVPLFLPGSDQGSIEKSVPDRETNQGVENRLMSPLERFVILARPFVPIANQLV